MSRFFFLLSFFGKKSDDILSIFWKSMYILHRRKVSRTSPVSLKTLFMVSVHFLSLLLMIVVKRHHALYHKLLSFNDESIPFREFFWVFKWLMIGEKGSVKGKRDGLLNIGYFEWQKNHHSFFLYDSHEKKCEW